MLHANLLSLPSSLTFGLPYMLAKTRLCSPTTATFISICWPKIGHPIPTTVKSRTSFSVLKRFPNNNRSIGLFASITCHHLRFFPPIVFSFQGAMHILRKTSTGILLQNCLCGKATNRVDVQPSMPLKKTARTGPCCFTLTLYWPLIKPTFSANLCHLFGSSSLRTVPQILRASWENLEIDDLHPMFILSIYHHPFDILRPPHHLQVLIKSSYQNLMLLLSPAILISWRSL